MPPTSRAKGKGKAKAPPSDNESESGKVLEYDESQDEAIEESSDSGSEFMGSEVEVEIAPSPAEEDGDDDMLDIDRFNAAVKMSLQFGFPKLISSSSLNLEGLNLENVRRCAAVERRFAHENKDIDVDDYQMEFDSDDSDSSAEAPLSQLKKKGKVAIKSSLKKVMTMSELRQNRREHRKTLLASRRANKKEEQEMIRVLGRRLTHVSFHLILCCIASLSGFKYRQKRRPLL